MGFTDERVREMGLAELATHIADYSEAVEQGRVVIAKAKRELAEREAGHRDDEETLQRLSRRFMGLVEGLGLKIPDPPILPRPVALLKDDGTVQAVGKVLHVDYLVRWDDTGAHGTLRDAGLGSKWVFTDQEGTGPEARTQGQVIAPACGDRGCFGDRSCQRVKGHTGHHEQRMGDRREQWY